MKHAAPLIAAFPLALALPAIADTDAAELWAEWQAQAALAGQTISAVATPTENGLRLSRFTTEQVQDGVTTHGAMDRIEMTENADGTVSITFSEVYSIGLSFDFDAGAPPSNIELQMRHEGLAMEVSGDPGARVYDYSADRLTLTDGAIWGGPGDPPEIEMALAITDLRATYRLFGTDAETMRFASESTVGGVSLSMEVTPAPPEQGYLKVGLMVGALSASGAGSVISLGTVSEVADGVPAGLEGEAALSYAALDFEISLDAPTEDFALLYGNAGGNLEIGLSETALDYDVAATGARARFTSSDIPVPVEFSVGSSALAFRMPLAQDAAPQDVALRLALEDLTLGEGLLGLIDPGRAIPRDPASLIFDATGQVRLFANLLTLDPDALDTPPGELRALNVSDLRLSVGEAELSGTADMTFAPGQTVPMPVGRADLQLSGGNALLDALIAGGMVPPQQGAFVRGTIAAFSRPGAAPDTLETAIEFGADGTVTANGIALP